jgi:hypothetical protein
MDYVEPNKAEDLDEPIDINAMSPRHESLLCQEFPHPKLLHQKLSLSKHLHRMIPNMRTTHKTTLHSSIPFTLGGGSCTTTTSNPNVSLHAPSPTHGQLHQGAAPTHPQAIPRWTNGFYQDNRAQWIWILDGGIPTLPWPLE